jgi:hypothetical protein
MSLDLTQQIFSVNKYKRRARVRMKSGCGRKYFSHALSLTFPFTSTKICERSFDRGRPNLFDNVIVLRPAPTLNDHHGW